MLTDNCEKSKDEKIFNDIIKQLGQNKKKVCTNIEIQSTKGEQKFERCLRNALEKALNLSRIHDEKLEGNKEFEIFQIKLFDAKDKQLISSESYYGSTNYYWINCDNKYFYIPSGNFSKLYYYNSQTKEKKIFRGLEESQQNDAKLILQKKNSGDPVSKVKKNDNKLIEKGNKNEDKKEPVPKEEQNDANLSVQEKKRDDKNEPVSKEEQNDAKLILQEDKKEDKIETMSTNEEDNEFLQEIKFNLISRKTFSYFGEIDNIPNSFFENYYVDALLMTKGKEPYAIYLGKGKDNIPGHGKIHYLVNDYYVKLIAIKGQFDGAYNNPEPINLKSFKCDIICKTFDEIKEKSNILFEFKNGKGGENKVLSQAKRYQENAKVIFGDNSFYHIIIVRKDLGNALSEKIKKINIKEFNNFAILKLEDTPKIFGKLLSEFKNPDNAKTEKSFHQSAKSHTTQKSNDNTPITRAEFRKEMDSFKAEINGKMNDFNKEINSLKNNMIGMDSKMDSKMDYILKKLNELSTAVNSISGNNSPESKK